MIMKRLGQDWNAICRVFAVPGACRQTSVQSGIVFHRPYNGALRACLLFRSYPGLPALVVGDMGNSVSQHSV